MNEYGFSNSRYNPHGSRELSRGDLVLVGLGLALMSAAAAIGLLHTGGVGESAFSLALTLTMAMVSILSFRCALTASEAADQVMAHHMAEREAWLETTYHLPTYGSCSRAA